MLVAFHFLLAQHLDGHVRQVTDNGLDVPAHVAHFGKLGRFHFQKGGVGQFGKTACDFSFTHTGGADHKDVFWCDLFAQTTVQLHPAPAVAQGDGYGTLGLFLAHDVFVELVDNLTGGHCRHASSGSIVG